jgi:phytoene dehydrogenase-like protein
MAPRSVIIVGGGIAGLAAGCYARMNGLKATIVEQHFLPGGLCTSWERKGYVFDGCLSYLYGTAPGLPYNRLWQELHALEGRRAIQLPELIRIRDHSGQELVAYADPARLEEHMLSLSPGDAGPIKALARGIRDLAGLDMSILHEAPPELRTAVDWGRIGLRMLPYTPATARWALVSAEDFADRFSDPFLRRAVKHMFGWPEIPMLAAISLLAAMARGNAAFPEGGSLELARAVERRFKALGGEILYQKRVDHILTEGGRAVGVLLYSDEEIRADYVISAADTKSTIEDMLSGEFRSRPLERMYSGGLPIHSQVQVSLGVRRDLSAEPVWTVHLPERPYRFLNEERDTLVVKHFCFDPTLAPPGKSVVEMTYRIDYRYFERIYGNKLYDTEQLQVAEQALGQLERVWPGIGADVEATDVATPLSYERYTGNWQGSSCGWLLSKQTMLRMITGVPRTLRGLRNLFLAGQWVEPGGGVAMCAASGRNAVRLICASEGVPFVTAP